MRILILSNPISGSGRAALAGEQMANQLRSAGHEVAVCHTRPRNEPTTQWLDEELKSAELMVVAGGDGAVRMVSESASRAGVPVYHLPCGTENLFAREFGMTRSAQTLLGAIEKFDVRNADMGVANGESFLLMASVGYDAEVVHELAGRRGTSISHWSYLGPIWKQIRRWRPSRLEVIVDGERIDERAGRPGEPGFVVVGNSRQYGWRLNPAGRASMFDGQFDVVFFPARSRLELMGWALRCRFQRHLNHPKLVYRLGKRVSIICANHCKYQLDGDPAEQRDAGTTPDCPLRLDIEMKQGALPVLVP